MIIRAPKIWNSRIYISFNFLIFSISIYVSSTKVKAHGENSVYKGQKLPKNLNGSNWTQIGLESGPEMLIFCCRNSTGTKQKLVEVKSNVQLPWTFFNISGTQSRIQRFKRKANRTPDEQEMTSGLLCAAAGLMNSVAWTVISGGGLKWILWKEKKQEIQFWYQIDVGRRGD